MSRWRDSVIGCRRPFETTKKTQAADPSTRPNLHHDAPVVPRAKALHFRVSARDPTNAQPQRKNSGSHRYACPTIASWL